MNSDRRAHRKYTSDQIRKRAMAIKKNRKKKKATKGEMVMIAFVIIIILTIFFVSYKYGIK